MIEFYNNVALKAKYHFREISTENGFERTAVIWHVNGVKLQRHVTKNFCLSCLFSPTSLPLAFPVHPSL